MKLFSTKIHGILDYLTVAALPILPRVFGWDDKTRRLCDGAAVSVLAYSLLTNYELGATPVLPMKKHLAADALWGIGMCAAPAALREKNPGATVALVGFGLFALFASQTTENYSPRELTALPAGADAEFHSAPRLSASNPSLPA